MKRFLAFSSVFMFLILVFNTTLYFISKEVYLGKYSDYPRHFKSYLLSDSHGLPLSNFLEKKGIYNFSEASESYFDMSRKINFLIKHKLVDTIYLTADDHELSPYREKANNLDKSIFYTNADDYTSFFDFIVNRYMLYYLVVFQPKPRDIIRSYFFSPMKQFFEVKSGKKETEKSQVWDKFTENKRIELSRMRAREQFNFEGRSIKLKNKLLEIVQTCKQHKIVLIGVKFPLSKEYIHEISGKLFNADKILTSKGVKVLDFKNVFQSKTDFFINQDHLNEKGGKAFVELFEESIN